MAHSMIRRRQEAERQRDNAYEITLRRVFAAARPAPDFGRALDEARAGLAGQAIRDGAMWRPKLKTRDPGRLRLAAARHLYARYPVGTHLEVIWMSDDGIDPAEQRLRRRWYATVARGDSLYKAGASEWMSRKEVHAFLNAPDGLDFEQAFWFAIARGMGADATAFRVARSKIAFTPRSQINFWRDAARLFTSQAAGTEEIDDLADYLAARLRADASYSLKGRTLASLRRASDEWHRDVAAIARIEAMQRRQTAFASQVPVGRWAGAGLPDWSWRPPGEEAKARREEYAMVQLTSASDLVAESRAMHHCVWTYAEKCIAGYASIWSLRLKSGKSVSRLLTVELDRRHRAVQVRGFGNRVATSEENRVLDRWAKANGVWRL
ncbi:PcfJ domain-containing protein [Mesorhizobium sp. YM1C-6-2]|uniref:PcfJ domain-containing protein n=1 Tax=Mesorhizobium sp. YM1C-6-2 TaxID=1827501 RepID=UPI000EF1B705|nr:PcfJ domain-containing protein [Mesorhizobium sp. YM1C-6-2]RLP25345.1 hypothetical protein D8676_12995 [Mesorhizobium sp. YM1C-6-2]